MRQAWERLVVGRPVPKDQEDEPTFVRRFVTNQGLINELRRRLVQGRNHAHAQHRRAAHLALMQAALLSSGEQASLDA